MGNIVLLDDLTINKIAAGEVIERPANVVKELVENSIDAGATQIIVETQNGGKTLIKVTDNGKGMQEDDIDISIERHATSKIRKVEDLEQSYTMGFRGEALASIASISELSISTKTKENITGVKMYSKAGEILQKEEYATKVGTQITVENIFFNTPVRYKFLKKDSTENKCIKDWIQKAAMANLNIAFKLIQDKRIVFSSSGNGKIQDIIYMIYGKEIAKNILDVDYKVDNMRLQGVIGNTMIAKETRQGQIIFLNNRNIKNPSLTNSIDQAFKGAIGIEKYGFCILNLEMPASEYDINVHPTKMEVRFKNEEEVYRFVYHGIKSAMLKGEFLGAEENDDKEKYVENEYNFLSNNTQKQEEKEIHREEKRKIEYKYIGILFRTYILIEINDILYMVDQHAAHERVLYEEIKNNYKNNVSQNTQMSLISEIYNLSHREIEFVKQNMELLKNTGFDIEFFGENTIKINGIPDIEYRGKSKDIFLDILDEMLLDERTSIKDLEERFIATVACKAAVKANMDLTINEVDNLIQNLFNLNNPYTCPHGRPTAIPLFLEEELHGKFIKK